MSIEKMAKMSREEIIKTFSAYGFKDPLGNDFEDCADFHDLLELAGKGETETSEKPETI